MRTQSAALLVTASLLFAGFAAAQTPSATITGRVSDPTNASVGDATIEVRNVGTNEKRVVRSASDGDYTVSSLNPGTYDVSIAKEGFKSVHDTGVVLEVDQTARLDAHLEVGTITQTVDVTAGVPLVNTENSTLGDVVTTPEITEMPLDGRNFTDLAFMVPGVTPSEQKYKGSPYTMNGARADSSDVVIDGFSDESPRDAGAQVQVPLDSLQEFKLQTSSYSAEYGRLAGGVTNMVLKSGGNDLHGTLFEFVRNDDFDARNFFSATTAELRRNQFGGTATGPVRIPKIYNGHDKTFFVASWESYREVQGSPELGVVPSALERQGNFSQDYNATGGLILLKDPLASGSCSATSAAACFPGNIIPANRMSPIGVALLNYFPLPNYPGVNNFLAYGITSDFWSRFLFKIDQKIGNKDSLAIRFSPDWETSVNPFSGSNLGTFPATTTVQSDLVGISEIHIFTPNLINEFRAGLTRTKDQEIGGHAGQDIAGQLGIPGTTTNPGLEGFPKFSITGYETLGDNSSDPIRYTVNNYNYSNIMTWVKGRHTIRFGAEANRVQYFQPTNSNFNGTFTFKGTYSNDAIADMLLGSPTSTSLKTGNATNYLFSTDFGAFIQDDFKVTSNLTLNLGMRYEIQTPPIEKYGQLTNYDPALGQIVIAGDAALPNLSSIMSSAGLGNYWTLSSSAGLPFSTVYTNYKNFAPRLGLAWRPFGNSKTVVRTGYGIFYSGSRLNPVRTDLAGGFPFSISETYTAPTANNTTVTLANPFPASLLKLSGTTTTNGFEAHAPIPYVQSWNVTVERELGHAFALEVNYAGSEGTHLSKKYDVNQEIHPTDTSASVRPFGYFGEIDFYSFNSTSSYNSGTVTIRRRFAKGLFMRANYTFAKSLDNASGENYAGAGGYEGAQNSYDLTAERGRSDFDVRNYFSANFIYQLPLGHNFLLRGWQLAGTFQVHSGQPFTPQESSPTQDLGEPTRPNRLANGALSDPTVNMWYNLAAFQVLPSTSFIFGNSGRNILDGPGFMAINTAFSRNIAIREHARLQIRWELFNLTNHPNFTLPNVDVDTSAAGTITSAGNGREMQFGARLSF
jgi:hypothetical protein